MISIKIISPTPGITTKEQVLRFVEEIETGVTLKQISERVNRPISMLQVCLKQLISMKKVRARKSKVSRNLIYYPRS